MNITRALAIHGWMSEAELAWLAGVATGSHCIVELGCYLGRSTRALVDNTSGHVHAIDDWLGVREDPCYNPDDPLFPPDPRPLIVAFMANMADVSDDKLIVHRQDHATATIAHTPDFVFIDGSHDEDSVRRDVTRWHPQVAPRGIMAGHDYYDAYPGLVRAVDELLVGVETIPGTTLWVWRHP